MADFHLWATYALIAATVIAYAADRWPLEMVAFASLAGFVALFAAVPYTTADGNLVGADELLAGFANPALVTVIALLIVGQGLFATDAMDGPARALSRLGGQSGWRTMAATLLAAAMLSAFLNNTPVVIIFIPVLTVLAAQRSIRLTGVLMPLSFITILGGMTTLIGSSTNLLVAGVAARAGSPVGFFDITPVGLILAAAGAFYVIVLMPRILGRGMPAEADSGPAGGTQFIGDIRVTENHPFIGMESRAGMFPRLKELSPRMVIRDGDQFLPPYEDIVLRPDDVIVISGTRRAFLTALASGSAPASGNGKEANGADALPPGPGYFVAEAIVAPASRHAGRLVRNAGIGSQHGVSVIGVQRKSRMGRAAMNDIRLEAGDTILIGGTEAQIKALRGDHDLLLLEWSAVPVPQQRKAGMAAAIFAGIVLLAATGIVPIVATAVVGAFLMVATGCLTLVQAARAFDRQIYALVGASLAAATALEQTGGARLIADSISHASMGAPPALILSMLFAVIAVMTNFLSNNAAAVLFAPVAISMADSLGVGREAFIACVIFAANTCFATPIGYQTNLLVMAPGGYSFNDFLRAGLPLVILVWLVFSVAAPLYYGLL